MLGVAGNASVMKRPEFPQGARCLSTRRSLPPTNKIKNLRYRHKCGCFPLTKFRKYMRCRARRRRNTLNVSELAEIPVQTPLMWFGVGAT